MTLQQRVRQLVAEHGTLRAAAKAVSVEVSYLSRLEHGEKTNPSEAVLERLGLVRVVTYRKVSK